MRPEVAVVLGPGGDDCSCIVCAVEPVEIRTVLAELAVAALSGRMLAWLAGLNQEQLAQGIAGRYVWGS